MKSFVCGVIIFAACVTVHSVAWADSNLMVLRRGTANEPRTLDPHLCAGNACGTMIGDLFVGLVTDDPRGQLTAGAAKTWTISNDGLVYTFTLRDDLQWSDGVPLTSQDFVYSLRRSLDPQSASQGASILYPIRNARAVNGGALPVEELGVTAPNLLTVEIALEKPTPYFPEVLLNSDAMPVPHHVIEEHGRLWTRPGTMVTNGAYVLDEWVSYGYIKAVKNGNFYDADSVRIDEVYYHPTSDLSTSFKRFRAGELDVALNFPPGQLNWIRDNMPDALRLHPMLGIYFYIFNTAAPPFDDMRVRRALSLAVNRNLIVDQILGAGNRPAYGIVPPGIANYVAQPPPDFTQVSYEERLVEARLLLAQAGFDETNPLQVTLRYNTHEEHRRIAIALAGMWQAVNVETELANSEMMVVSQDLRSGRFELARSAWYAAYNDPIAFLQLFESDKTDVNFSGYANPAYDAILADAAAMKNLAARALVLRDAEALAMTDHPVIPIYYYVGKRLVSPVVKGWIDNPRSVNRARHLWIEQN